jgi:hypothetical protein
MLTNEMPVIGPNPLGNVYGVVDAYNTALPNNGALNPLGSVWTIPSPSQGGNTTLATATGYGSFLTVKYVRYNSTANAAVVAGPAIVYYTDETFTTVSGTFTEGNPTGTGSTSAVAGFMLPNKGTVAGIGLGTTAFTAALLNTNYVFIAVEGFVPSASLGFAGTQNNPIMGGAGAFITALTTGVNRTAGYIWGAVTSQVADVLVTCGTF